MTASETDELFAQTLAGDYDSDEAWSAVHVLRRNGSLAIFERAASWCRSRDHHERARSIDILCQLQRTPDPSAAAEEPEWLFREESVHLITGMLVNEKDPTVLTSAIYALGHLANKGSIPEILRYQAYPEDPVRLSVAFALGCFPHDSDAVLALIQLTSDHVAEIRDWAVFSLGVQGDSDSTEVRQALIRCLDDGDENVREEALVGLAKRQDLRIIPKLQMILAEPELKLRVAEAAASLLGLEQDPPEWGSLEYREAIARKFPFVDVAGSVGVD